MHLAFAQSVFLPRDGRLTQARYPSCNPRSALVMTARRPGTRNHSYSFRHGTLFSQSKNKNPSTTPPSQTEEDGVDEISTIPSTQSLEPLPLSDAEQLATESATVHDKASLSTKSNGTAAAPRTSANPPQGETAPRSVSFRVPILGTIELPASVVLMFVPFLWASYSIVVKWIYRLPWSLNIALFNFLRLLLTSLLVLPAFNRKTITKPVVIAGVELGAWTICANILQITGLRYTTASRAAFLSQLSTVLVPLIAVAVGMESRLAMNILISAPLSVLGVALLTLDGAAPSLLGDSIMMGVALVGASFILRSKKYSYLPTNTLVASKTIFQTLFAGIFYFMTSASATPISFAGATPFWLGINAGLLLWCGFFIGYLATLFQMRGQAVASASEAAVIFTSNPLWASLLAIPLGERFGPKGFAGASLILLATALASGIGIREKPQKKIGEVG